MRVEQNHSLDWRSQQVKGLPKVEVLELADWKDG